MVQLDLFTNQKKNHRCRNKLMVNKAGKGAEG